VEDIKSLLGKRIRNLRKQKGLSQEELGWKSELHFTYIGAVERGERNCSIMTLKKIAKGLEIDIKGLFDSPDPKIDINKLRKEINNKVNLLSPQALIALKEILKLIDANMSN
jgi:transcriptional regulator with XRE-family HTH domain